MEISLKYFEATICVVFLNNQISKNSEKLILVVTNNYRGICCFIHSRSEIRSVFPDMFKNFDNIWHNGLSLEPAASITRNVLRVIKDLHDAHN